MPRRKKEIAEVRFKFLRRLDLYRPAADGGRLALCGRGRFVGAADRPIFWYRPQDSKKYRVIYADLSVREADTPPSRPNVRPAARPASAAKK